MAGVAPPPDALMAQRVELSAKVAEGYPQPSLPPVAGGIVTPGVHDGAPETGLQLAPMVPLEEEQSDPLQQRFGRGGVWGVHVRLGAQPPVESQRHPRDPTTHVVGAPEPAFVPPPPSPLSTNDESSPPPSPPPSLLENVDDESPQPWIESTKPNETPTALPTNNLRLGMSPSVREMATCRTDGPLFIVLGAKAPVEGIESCAGTVTVLVFACERWRGYLFILSCALRYVLATRYSSRHECSGRTRRDDASMTHWRTKVLTNSKAVAKTIVVDGHVVGNVVSWDQDGKRLVGYWVGRAYWGKGVATVALADFGLPMLSWRCTMSGPFGFSRNVDFNGRATP